MIYLEFKQAAKKHYRTAECLYESCNNHWHIQENIFYLCGYVIEMMLKYRIFEKINYDSKKDIKKLDSYNLTYSNDINKHNINSLIRILQERSDNTPIFNEVKKIFAKWNVAIRYNGERNNYSNSDIEKLLKLSQKVIEKFEG